MISTHIMQEVEAICNRVIIINKGKLVADGTIAQLKAGSFAQKQSVLVEFDKSPDIKALKNVSGVSGIETVNKTTFLAESDNGQDIRPELFHFAVQNQLIILTLKEHQQSLEHVFQDLTRTL